MGPPSPEVTGVICRVPSASFSQAPWYALPVHLCRFRVRSISGACFLEQLRGTDNPISPHHFRHSCHPSGPGILPWFPSSTAFALAVGTTSTCRASPFPYHLVLSEKIIH